MLPEFVIPTTFKCTNPGGAPFVIDAEKWTLKRYQDLTTNARELDITTKSERQDSSPPIQQFAEILATDGADISFRGYVERYKKTSKENVYYCRGVENLLYHRYLNKWNYVAQINYDGSATTFTLANAVKDHYTAGYPIGPATTDNCPGILHVANSLMPWGMPFEIVWIGTPPVRVIKYTNWGTQSRMGTAPVLYYVDDNGVYPLTQRGALADLITYDKSFYIDTTELYIRNSTNLACTNFGNQTDYWWLHGRILADNVFDTKIRLGTLDHATDPLEGYLKFAHTDVVANVLFGIIKNFGLYAYLEDRIDFTYLHAWIPEGLVPYPSGAVYTLDETEKETISWEESIPSKPHVHSLRGYGDAEQIYSWVDYTHKGLWYEDVLNVAHGYRDANGILINTVNAEYNNRANDYQVLVKTARKIAARPGDMIRVIGKYDPAYIPYQAGVEPSTGLRGQFLPINVITNSSDNTTALELNHKTPKYTNAWQVAGQLGSPYSNYNMIQRKDPATGTCTFSLRDATYPNCAVGSVSLTCPDLTDPVFVNPRVLLDISLTPTPPNQQALAPEAYMVMIAVHGTNDTTNEDSIIYNYSYGDPISYIDITNLVTNNAANIITITMYYLGGIVGSTSCSTQLNFTAYVTMSFWNRINLFG